MEWYVIVLIAVAIVVVSYIIARSPDEEEAFERQLTAIPDFNPTQKIMGLHGKSGIAIDEDHNKVCLLVNRQGTEILKVVSKEKLAAINVESGLMAAQKKRDYLDSLKMSVRVISSQDILSTELFEDGITVTKTVRSSQIGLALIGGIAFGGIGAVIGGLSGKTHSSKKIQRVALRLIVNDTVEPLHEVTFLDTETNRDGILYKLAMEKARHWHGLMEVVIKRADMDDRELCYLSLIHI